MTDLWPNTPAAEFQQLINRRDAAAYKVVAVLGVVLDFWEAQDFEESRKRLELAREQYRAAEARIAEFYRLRDAELLAAEARIAEFYSKRLPKGETNGNRSAA